MSLLEKEKEDLFFVEVKDPVSVRRDVLEAQKIVIESLQRYENIKLLRTKKLENINKLRSILKESSKLFSNLKAALPQTSIKAVVEVKKKPEVVEEVKKAKVKETKKVKKRTISELEKLEAELSAIENKLSSLK